MGRSSTIWQRKRDGFWMTTIQGKQIKLSKDKAEARRVFYKLMGGEKKPAARCPMTVRKLCDTYLDRTREGKSEARHKVQLGHLTAFCAAFGARRPDGLRAHEINEWLDGLVTKKPRAGKAAATPVSQSTKALIVMILKAVMNWAVGEDHLAENPLARLKRRKIARRHRILTDDERERILARASPAFRDFLLVLDQTGCRPFSEAAKLTAAKIDFELGRAVLKEHKNAHKGKSRVVYFPPAVLARLKVLAEEHPTGPILRNRLGNKWIPSNVAHYLQRVGLELGIEPFAAYDFRHTFISSALVKGVPVEVVAELVGTSAKIIWSNYASVEKVPGAMQAAAQKAVG